MKRCAKSKKISYICIQYALPGFTGKVHSMRNACRNFRIFASFLRRLVLQNYNFARCYLMLPTQDSQTEFLPLKNR